MTNPVKKSFLLHIDSLEILDELTDEQAGKLFRAIYSHHIGETIELDALTRVAFTPFKNQFSRDAEKYKKTVDRNRINGLKGGRPPEANNPQEPKITQDNPVGLLGTQDNPSKAKKADSDSDSDSDSDNGKGKGNDKDKPKDQKTMPSKLDDEFEILQYLNFKTGSNYQHVESNNKFIRARIGEGRTVDEIKSVIDYKCLEWPKGHSYRKYLRPATLFNAEKFNNYFGQLGQPIDDKNKQKEDKLAARDKELMDWVNNRGDGKPTPAGPFIDNDTGVFNNG